MTLEICVLSVFLLWSFLKTASYGKWSWNNKDRLGSVMVFIVAFVSLVLPLYLLISR
ncbi:MAG: hypothetical protein GX992_06050 [Clostridium sp.]|nr:hypothetical protein [Clostridium sp.]